MNESPIKQALSDLKLQVDNFYDSLNTLSEDIHSIERQLQSKKLTIDFTFNLGESQALSWEYFERDDKFRFIFADYNVSIRVPAVESKLPIRLSIHKHLVPFLRALEKEIIKHQEIIEQSIEYSVMREE